ncbi:MAG: FAD-dependent oxidoreductase, partial [Rhizobiales bacterium]|nr:FAD-dependent oxidoreductase [Hyphomicrobiales bacterium]
GFDCDIVIIGAGLAGAAAASIVTGQGKTAIILEARDRAGGRAFTRPFSAGGDLLEFGGSWITPWHDRVRHYAELTGTTLRPRSPVTTHWWNDGTTVRSGEPASKEARAAFDRAMARIATDALRYKAGERTDADGQSMMRASLNQYLDRIDAGPEARNHVMAWWTVSGNGDPAVISASEFLSSCAYGEGRPEGMIDKLQDTLVPGAGILASRIIEKSGAELRLSSPVVSIDQSTDQTIATCANGESVKARGAIVCLPINALNALGFTPALSPVKRAAIARGHGGKAIKVWIKARGVAVGELATGGIDGLSWMFAERKAEDGTTLIVSFGIADPKFNPDDRHAIAGALQRFFPKADLVAWDWHDWVADSYARGTWVALPADMLEMADPGNWQPEGRLAFATSDIASDQAGWFEGAIIAGEEAARALLRQSNAL